MSVSENKQIYGYSNNFFHANDIIRVVTGLWRPGNNTPIWIKLPYYIYVCFIYINGFGYNICEYSIFNEMLKDIPKLLSYIGMCLTHTLGMIKFGIFVFGQKKFDKIMNNLQHDDFKYVSLDENGPSAMFAKEKRISNSIAYWICGMYTFVGVSAHISTLLSLHREVPGDTFEGTNKTCYDFMPYFFRIPFPTETKRECIWVSNLVDVGFATWAFVISYYDGVFVGVLKCFKVQLVIVGHVIRTIRQRSLRSLNMPEDLDILHDEDYPELEKEMYKQLVHVIQHIQLLLGVRDDIEQLVTFVTLIQTLCSLFIFASCMYVASIVPMTSPEFFAQMQFFTCVLIQLSLICWSGNEITIAGQYLGTALFECDWFSCSKRFKSSMLMTMTRMQRPIVLTIGKFTPLTITTLVNVVRGSFSYFAVFKTVK